MPENTCWNIQYKTLDHWRGVAVLWVMLFHGFGTTYEISLHPLAEFIKILAAPGWLGVHIFFVISGYCIAANVYNTGTKNGNCWSFIKNRVWRVVPAYWAAFLLTIVLNLISSPFNRTSFSENFPPSLRAWLGNILLIQPYLNTPFYTVVYWSLVVEMGFYLVVALLLIIAKKIKYKLAVIVFIILSFISIFIPPSPRTAVLVYWSEFVCGILVFNTLLANSKFKLYQRNLFLCFMLLLGLLSIVVSYMLYRNYLWFSVIFALILCCINRWDENIASIKKLKCLKFIGVISYSLYLLHLPFQGRVVSLGLRCVEAESILFLAIQILGWWVAIIVSYIFYRLVEKPLEDWRHQQKTALLHQ